MTWSGAQVVIHGGALGPALMPLDDGARYDPAFDVWLPLPEAHASAARTGHSALFTGTGVVIFGGLGAGARTLDDGAILDL